MFPTRLGRQRAACALAILAPVGPAWAQPRPGAVAGAVRLLHVHNRVEVSPARGPGDAEVLPPGAQITTHQNAAATLRYESLGDLQLAAQSRVELPGPAAEAAQSREPTLLRGAVRVLVSPAAETPDATLTLHTRAGAVTMTRGEYRVHVDSSDATRVVTYRGHARVTAGPRSVSIDEGTAARIDRTHPGVAAYPPVFIPRAPVWTQGMPPRVITFDGTASVEGRYAPPPRQHNAPRRWVQCLARDAAFEDIVFERDVAADETRFAAERLPAGEYFARVVSVDGERYESRSSAVQRFEIVAPRVIPGDHGRQAAVFVPRGLYCRLDDVALPSGAPFVLVPGRAHVLLCSIAEDMRSPTRVAISAEQSGEVLHEVHLESPWIATGGAGSVAIRLRDAAGRAYPYANIAVRASPGVEVDVVREDDERGLYLTRVSYRPDTPVTLEFVVNDTVRFSERLGGPTTAPPPR